MQIMNASSATSRSVISKVSDPHEITSPACFYHIEPLSWDQLSNQEGWVPAVGNLYYELNPIPFDDFRIILLDRPFIKMDFIRSRVIYMA